ncbi:putative ABC transport system permease protein [Mesonia algae]|uniref:Putative ABC transport system permease protein n=1 Tax=Mesonia algae TaxID=213248 RepID=A0A2W7IQH6_9FLAO|nr:ABC transporter permease [Mesonia algae]PZW41687.1 putative ABC transport system permease protein [Mesonia algae]
MFNLERWEEIFETISKNKLRTFLTGLSVLSGIFILVILLGVSQGMQNGISSQFQDDAANVIFVWTGVTSVEYKGMNPGRVIQLRNKDYDHITKLHKDELEYKSSVYRIWGGMVTYKKESGSYRVEGVYPDYQFLENQTLIKGRHINTLDIDNSTKSVVIGKKVNDDLFKDQDAIGKYVKVSGVNFKVVGVYSDPGGEREESRVFVPISTAQKVFSGANRVNFLSFSLPMEDNFEKATAASVDFSDKIEKQLKETHDVAPQDESAISVNNSLENAKRFYDLMGMIKMFFWFVGIATILAGVIGVSNIMLIIVKERTKEIGIRKALGAQPLSIVTMILHESIFVTAIAGFLGLFLGLVLLEFVGPMVETEFIANPSVNFQIAITTVIILIVAGAFAGFFPAWRAARIKPIIALRDE